MASAALLAAEPTPTTNRGVYPTSKWGESAFDYHRSTVAGAVNVVIDGIANALGVDGRPVTREQGPPVKHYSQHIALTDRLGRIVASVFWGGATAGSSGHPNVEAKGSNAPAVARIIRERWQHRPSRIDVKRDATREGLFADIRELAGTYATARDIRLQDWSNNHPDMGDTCYLGSRASQAFVRIYQPGLKLAQHEGRTADQISTGERHAVRVELQFQPQKQAAKRVGATRSPDELWGVSQWIADFAGEVFAMNVQPISISDRRESNRNRALRYMATQYRAHLADLLRECGGDVALAGSTIFDLADIPYSN